MSAQLAGLAGVLAFAAAWELAGMSGRRGNVLPVLWRRADWAQSVRDPFGTRSRLVRAGLERRVDQAAFARMRWVGALIGLVAFALTAPVAPGRFAPILGAGLLAAGFASPDAWAEKVARRRRSDLQSALPDALDLIAVGAAAGRAPAALMREIVAAGPGALAEEFGLAVAEIDCGVSQERAFTALWLRTAVPELGAFTTALERSRRYGSSLADQLHAQASTLRTEERRRIEERAARAAPKIQLVIALVLVPSALLLIVAALIAHSGSLVGAL